MNLYNLSITYFPFQDKEREYVVTLKPKFYSQESGIPGYTWDLEGCTFWNIKMGLNCSSCPQERTNSSGRQSPGIRGAFKAADGVGHV